MAFDALKNPLYPTDLINAELAPADSIPSPAALPMNKEPVNKLSVPSNIKAEPDIGTLSRNVTVSAVLPFISKYSIKKS